LYVISVLGGLGVIVPVVAAGPSSAHAHHHASPRSSAAPATALSDAGSWLAEWRHWILMVLAMMVPVVAPYARRVALRSLWRRRHRAMTWFLLGYLAVWFAIGAALSAVLVSHGRAHAWAVVPITLLGAAAWQISPPRRRALRRCGSLPPGVIRGWRADCDCATTGFRIGLRCAFVCGPVMLAMAVSHSLILMGGVFAMLLSERARGPNPDRRAGRPLEAWGLVTLAAVVAALAI
jgi:predicted metal-binding membrane protein